MAVGFVRPARPGDAGEIARIQVATWRVAYRRLFPRHVLEDLDEQAIAGGWRDAIVAPPTGGHRVLVAVEQPASDPPYLVGFIAFGPLDEDHMAPGDLPSPFLGAVTELLVEPRWGRRGHGSRLLAAATDHWHGDSVSSAVVWVFDQAPAMGKFLGSAGWACDGNTRALDVDDMLVPQSRYACAL